MFFADSLSWAHTTSLKPRDLFDDEFHVTEIQATFNTIKQQYKTDKTMHDRKTQITNGWNTHDIPREVVPYCRVTWGKMHPLDT